MYNAASDILDGNLSRGRGDAPAIRVVGGDTVTYGELSRLANRFGNFLAGLGVGHGDRVLLALPDSPEFAAVFFGAIKLGAVPVPVNPNLKVGEYAFYLRDADPRVAVLVRPGAAAVASAAAEMPDPPRLVVLGAPEETEIRFADAIDSASSPDLAAAPAGPGDSCFWLYTQRESGPAAVVHAHGAMRACSDLYAKGVLGMEPTDQVFSIARLYFAYGLGNALYFPFAIGATAILLADLPAPARVLPLLRKERPTVFFGVPTGFAALMAWGHVDLSSVRVCVSAGERLSPGLFSEWERTTGNQILDGLGSTEAAHIFISNRPREVRPGSVGRVVPGYEATVVGDGGEELAPGTVGNLVVKGPSIFTGYWRQPALTAAAEADGWLWTGDRGKQDGDGFFHLHGRRDRMLKVGGIWNNPLEVEAVIGEHPAVRTCRVEGVVDDLELFRTEARVVLVPGTEGSDDLRTDLRAHVRAHLANYKCPREFHFVDRLD